MDPTYPLVPIANFFACLLVLLPISSKMFQPWNIGILMSALWTCITGIKYGVDTIVWSDNVRNAAPVWCDITSRLDISCNIALPACCFVITRHLSKIAKSEGLSTGRNAGRKWIIIDLSLCLCLPLVGMVLYYVVEDARFSIIEEVGCFSHISHSGLSILLIYSWPVFFPGISVLFFCPKTIWLFYRQWNDAHKLLDSNAHIDGFKYLQMMSLGSLNMLVAFSWGIMNIVALVVRGHLQFWPGWSTVHADWRPRVILKEEWESDLWANIIIRCNEWARPFFAVTFFLLFGLTYDARERYRRAFLIILKPLGFKPPVIYQLRTSGLTFIPNPINSGRIEISDDCTEQPNGESTADIVLDLSTIEEGFAPTTISFSVAKEVSKLKYGGSSASISIADDASGKSAQKHNNNHSTSVQE